uniref:Uncharacterized protein n=1 Tax=Oryza sativa subsp. japonica TaxID=39947 RepID=Q8GRI9_ORYSJ|nr:hypothetical protein [Oryza sativa Japonica Group]BAC22353.1 hypothetical protein [Oryza sativa Japonica Group]
MEKPPPSSVKVSKRAKTRFSLGSSTGEAVRGRPCLLSQSPSPTSHHRRRARAHTRSPSPPLDSFPTSTCYCRQRPIADHCVASRHPARSSRGGADLEGLRRCCRYIRHRGGGEAKEEGGGRVASRAAGGGRRERSRTIQWQNSLSTKYTIGVALPLRENDVGITSRAVSRGESPRPHGLVQQRHETVWSLGIEERDQTVSQKQSTTLSNGIHFISD